MWDGKTPSSLWEDCYDYRILVLNRCRSRLLHASGIRHGGNRFHQSQERWQHHHEKLDGLLHRYSGLHDLRLWPHDG